MKPYILLYGDKKPEDNICLKNMFINNCPINLGWTNLDYNYNMKIIEEQIKMDEKNKEIKMAKKVLEEISNDERERYLAELRQKYIMDQKAIEDAGFGEGGFIGGKWER